ncbi:uncharacterized protein LOC103310368 [Acyrthosiphon pisum]|uniref:Vacuolar ATPase assembly protein VMA22 n=1 Tax=Acyrthosiphon pisum TaxID=7029 RepID=A0A8R2B8R2_ACYPI|nr:uncharacterized protein LOC103310368 [Acyrthosiphon pisum]|eukprot:XP_008186678.1 PREDICTED: uncharacterized protein LOC103310368 [Acyrthosiphon pisum]
MGLERTAKQVDDELDGICLQMVQLMDEYCSNIGRLEHCLRDGCVHLAKSRYVMGHRSVSDLQLPTSGQYTARSTVVREEDTNVIRLACDESGDDPIKRFGVLVPGSLRKAQEGFCKCLESAIEAAIVKAEMETIQGNYLSLKNARSQMTNVVNK